MQRKERLESIRAFSILDHQRSIYSIATIQRARVHARHYKNVRACNISSGHSNGFVLRVGLLDAYIKTICAGRRY